MSNENEESAITPEALAMIGNEVVDDLGEVAMRDIRRYAVATGDRNPLYFDESSATASAYGGLIAPPAMLSAVMWTGDGTYEEDLRTDGISRIERQRIPLRVTRAMGGGQELEFFEPVRPGDHITRTSRIAEIYQRQSKLGTLVFTVSEQTYRNQDGILLMTCRSTSISH